MRKTRFSLYCLEDGDEYFGDVIADVYFPSNSKAATPQNRGPKSAFQNRLKVRGKLRLAGRAVFFDPDDFARPILMFKFKDVVKCEEYNLELVTEDEAAQAAASASAVFERAASPNAAVNFLVFRCTSVSTQMANGDPSAFGADVSAAPHVFSFPFGNAGVFVEQLNSLLSVERIADGFRRTQIVQRMVDIQQRQTPFSLTDLRSPEERVLCQQSCSRILPLVTQKGRVVVTTAHIYFQPTFPVVTPGIEVVSLTDVRRVERRRANFMDVGMELATFNDFVYLFAFPKTHQRDEVFHSLGSNPVLDRLSVNDVSAMMRKWIEGRVSTFDYLMFLNWSSGRSLNDLTQYPVLPWVLVDYSSAELHLDNPSVYRNFAKPIGALNETRLKGFRKRAEDLRSIGEAPYLYGSHYSTPAYVTFFKVRTHPEYMLVLHSGKLDQSSRIFESILDTFASVLTGPTDLKELIPEFFYGDGEFLKRTRIDLGTKPDGTKVSRDVLLPPWANESASEFVRLNRLALESEICSQSVHEWIDLIFGFKQQGDEAWKADNVFHPHCYETAVKNVHLLDESHRAAVELHGREFGQVPKQIFSHPHPRRLCGATAPHLISMENFMPPDSEELLPSQPRETQTTEAVRKGTAQRVADFVSSTVQGEDESDEGEEPVRRPPLPFSQSPRAPEKPPCVASQPKHLDVVQETLDVSHVTGPFEDVACSDSHSQPASGHKTAESADSKGDIALKLGPQFSVRVSTKGRIDSVAVCYVPTDADWIFEDYDTISVLPMIFASDPSGCVSIYDGVSQKRIRACAFGATSISFLLPTARDKELLVGSLSGTLYVVDLESCTVDTEYEDSCEAGATAVAAKGEIVVTGSKSGCTNVWQVSKNGCLKLPKAPLFVNDGIAKVTFVDCDTLGKRVLAVTADGTVTVTTIEDEDSISFQLPEKFSKSLAFCGFIRDHMIVAIGKYDVSILTLDGNEWGSYPSPVEVAFGGIGRGGALPTDAIVVTSPEGAVAVLNSNNGRLTLNGSIDQAQLAGSSITCGFVGHEHLVLGDSAGRVHVAGLLGL
jgi:hypothetical protein